MNVAIISLFPEIIQNYFNYGVISRSIKSGLVNIDYFNPRDYAEDKYSTVDDTPFGGGSGMVLKPDVMIKTIEAAINIDINNYDNTKSNKPKIIYLTPQGQGITQQEIHKLIKNISYTDKNNNINKNNYDYIFISGRYEGLDQRVIDKYVDLEYSIGDYILSGGELPILVLLDAMIRLIPGVLGNKQSSIDESFSISLSGLLEYPQYTKPAILKTGEKVPEVLLSGHHQEIKRWKMKQSLGRTWQRRPNLIKYSDLTSEQKALLEEFKLEQ